MTPTEKRKALLLVNHKSRSGRECEEMARSLLMERGFEVLIPRIEGPADFSDAIRDAQYEADLVIVGGGDGSVRCALEGVVATGLPLGVLPMGTANNLARNLGIPMNLADACDVIAHGERRSIDLAEVNGIYFLNVAGMGLSTQINRKVPSDLKKKWGVFAYIWYALKVVRRTKPFSVVISCDGQEQRIKALQITVCNGKHFGNGLTVASDATIYDGELDVLCIEAIEWWQGLRLLPSLWHGRRSGERAGLLRLRGREVKIETRRSFSIDTDGEVMTRTPAFLRVFPKELSIFTPVLEKRESLPRSSRDMAGLTAAEP